MNNTFSPPVYSQVALDIAAKIARGDIKQNEKITGRSLTSTQYNVSPETVRRALKLLADMGIVTIMQNSGALVTSREKASQYIEKYHTGKDIRSLKQQLKQLMKQREELDQQIHEITNRIVDLSERFKDSEPIKGLEFEIAASSALVGKSIEEAKFWQNTGATVIAIRRGERTILSPGPYATFLAEDVIIVAGGADTIPRIEAYLA